MIIEIGYSYQLDKTSPVQQSWTYFYIKSGDEDKAKTKAKAHFKKWVAELGWTKKAKITHTEVILNEKSYVPDFIVVSKSELPAARKRKSTSKSKVPSTRTPQRSSGTPQGSRTPRTRRTPSRRVSGKA